MTTTDGSVYWHR